MTVSAASESFELRSDFASRTYLPTLFCDALGELQNYVSTRLCCFRFRQVVLSWTSALAFRAISPASGRTPYLLQPRGALGRGGSFLALVVLRLEQAGPAR